MTDNEPLHMSFDNLPRAVAELHSKIDTLTEMVEKLMSANTAQPLSEIMTVEDVSAMLCKSVSTIYAMTSEHRIPYRKQGNKLYFMRTEIKSWLNDSVVPKDAPKRKSGHKAKDCSSSPDEPAPENEVVQSDAVSGTDDLQASLAMASNRNNKIHLTSSNKGRIQEAVRRYLPCVSPMNMKLPENGNSTRKQGNSMVTGVITEMVVMCSIHQQMQRTLPMR